MVTVNGWKSPGPSKHSLLQSPELLPQSPKPPLPYKPMCKVFPSHFELAEEVLLAIHLLPWEVMVCAEPKGRGSDGDSVTVIPDNGVSCAGAAVLLSLS